MLAPGFLMARLALLLSLGMWVTVTADSDLSEYNDKGVKAQIWVSSHLSYTDVIVLLAAVSPTPGFVAKRAVWDVPLVGACATAWGCVPVDRDQKKGATVIDQLRLRAAAQDLNPVVCFPEGTTTNGKYLIHFHRGAFVPGAPVKPVILRYPHTSFNPSWESISFPAHLFRFLTQMVNRCTVTLCPVYTPSPAEVADPSLYASNVRAYMAARAGLPVSDSTLEDKKAMLELLRGSARLD